MKSYEDIAERVFEKGDEILKRRQKRTALIRKTSLVVSEICAGVLICFGIWKTGDIQISMDHNFPDTVITESESATDSHVPVSTAPNNDDVIYASETVAVSEPNVEQTTFSAGSAPENIALNTSAPGNAGTAQLQTLINSAETQHKTTICTTFQVQTNLQTGLNTTQIPRPIQTTVCTTIQTENEGSIYMKKLTALSMSAIVIAASATPMIGNAEFKVDETRYWPGEKPIFAQMESGELDVDINGDGVFDIFDCYTMKLYNYNSPNPDFVFPNPEIEAEVYAALYNAVDRETVDRIEAIADYNGDGKVSTIDASHLVRYFIISQKMKREYFEPSYYFEKSSSDSHECTGWTSEERFAYFLLDQMQALHAGYDIVADMYEDGTIDLDFNGNGQLDIGDAYDIYVYQDCRRCDSDIYKCVKPDYIPEEDWDRCDAAYEMYPQGISGLWNASDGITSRYNFSYYVTLYIVGNIELKPEYFTEEYYKEAFTPYYRASSYLISYRVKDAAADLGLTTDEKAWIKYNEDDLDDIFVSYCRNVESGLRPAPDVNMDGVVDWDDYFVMNTYLTELIADKTSDDSILSAEIWNNINKNFDINGNGTTKDIYDIVAVQMYVIKYTDTSDYDAAYNRYQESLGENSTTEIESLSYEKKVDILADIESKTICGDVNCDGKVTIGDAAAILQYLGNNEQFPLKEIGKSNASSSDGVAGITVNDALTIQLYKVGLAKLG